MRLPIAVKVIPFDLNSAQSRIDEVREAFSRYLDHYIPKSSRSKHGLMGPVGKILSEAKSGRSDAEFLKGYVLRVHELSQKASPSPEALTALETGINLLSGLLREVPVTVHDRLIDRLDYGLYFARRKKLLEWLQERNQDYRAWLQQSYSTLESLNQAWGTQFKSWEQIRYAGTSSRIYKEASPKQREDMNKFAQYLRGVGKPTVAAIEETEEEPA